MGNFENVKKTRASKACDQCSRYRRKCDGGNPCLLCVEKGRECSYTKIAKKRGPGSASSKGLRNANDLVTDFPNLAVAPSNTTPPILTISPTNQLSPMMMITPSQSYSREKLPILLSPCPSPVSNWTRLVFLSTSIVDCSGNTGSILDMYFDFPNQHLPMFSRLWLIQNIDDVPMHVLHVIYMLVLVNAKQSLINGRLTARPHAEYVESVINERGDDCDPFMISTILNMAMYYFYLQESEPSIRHLAMGIRAAQKLGLDRDIDLLWPSSASGRILGNEIGMSKQFLRSIWFLMYQWDHYNMLVFRNSSLIDTVISEQTIQSYMPPNIGDQSNVSLNFLSHAQYSLPLITLSKKIFSVKSNQDRVELLYKLDTFHLLSPITYIPHRTIFLGRTISWINEIYNYSKFVLLIPLHLDPNFVPIDKSYISDQLKSCIDSMFKLANAFVEYSNKQVTSDQTFLLFSKTLFVAALVECMIGEAQKEEIEIFIEAIRLSAYPQDYSLIREAVTDQRKAIDALTNLLELND